MSGQLRQIKSITLIKDSVYKKRECDNCTLKRMTRAFNVCSYSSDYKFTFNITVPFCRRCCEGLGVVFEKVKIMQMEDNMVDINKIREALIKAKHEEELAEDLLNKAEDHLTNLRDRVFAASDKVAAYQSLLDDALSSQSEKQ